MRALHLLTGLVACKFTLVSASDILSRSIPGDRVLALGFEKQRHHGPGHSSSRLARRTVVSPLDNEYLLYYVDVEVGTPPQPMRLQIDTGSSDVWAPSANSDYCRSFDDPCTEGSYNGRLSTSRELVSRDSFKIAYLDGTHAQGDFITEVFTLGNCTIPDLQMGIGYDTDINAGILGIGYPANTASETLYPGLVENLVSHGFINSHAYSLYLNDQESNKGSILFGGIDTMKYSGKLVGLPIQLEKGYETPTDFVVALSSVVFIGPNGTESVVSDEKLGAVLDCGSSLTYLPNATIYPIIQQVGGHWNQESKSYNVPCSLSNNHNDFVKFQFGGPNGPVIKIPMEELTNFIIDVKGELWTNDDGNPECIFGIQPQPEDFGDTYIFEDTFLRSAYVVFDLDGHKIWMAQTIWNVTESDILEIQKTNGTKGGVPDARGVESVVSVTPTATTVQKLRPTAFTVEESTTTSNGQGQATSTSSRTATSSAGESSAQPTQVNIPSNGIRGQTGGLLGLAVGAAGCLLGAML